MMRSSAHRHSRATPSHAIRSSSCCCTHHPCQPAGWLSSPRWCTLHQRPPGWRPCSSAPAQSAPPPQGRRSPWSQARAQSGLTRTPARNASLRHQPPARAACTPICHRNSLKTLTHRVAGLDGLRVGPQGSWCLVGADHLLAGSHAANSGLGPADAGGCTAQRGKPAGRTGSEGLHFVSCGFTSTIGQQEEAGQQCHSTPVTKGFGFWLFQQIDTNILKMRGACSIGSSRAQGSGWCASSRLFHAQLGTRQRVVARIHKALDTKVGCRGGHERPGHKGLHGASCSSACRGLWTLPTLAAPFLPCLKLKDVLETPQEVTTEVLTVLRRPDISRCARRGMCAWHTHSTPCVPSIPAPWLLLLFSNLFNMPLTTCSLRGLVVPHLLDAMGSPGLEQFSSGSQGLAPAVAAASFAESVQVQVGHITVEEAGPLAPCAGFMDAGGLVDAGAM